MGFATAFIYLSGFILISLIRRQKAKEEKAAARLREAAHYQTELVTLLKCSRVISGLQSFEEVMRTILDLCSHLLGVGVGYVILFDRDGGQDKIMLMDSGEFLNREDYDYSESEAILEFKKKALKGCLTLFENNPANTANTEWTITLASGSIPVENILLMSMQLKSRQMVLLCLANKPGGFTEHNALIAESFGELATIAFNNIEMCNALKESRDFVTNILDSIEEGIIVMDAGHKIISANQAYCRMVSMPLEKVLGMRCYQNFNRPLNCAYNCDKCAVRQSFDSMEAKNAVDIYQNEWGEPVVLEVTAYPMKMKLGRTDTLILLIKDITDKRNMEKQLIQAQKIEAVGQLSGGIAHDFNNIISAIAGHAKLMQMCLKNNDTGRDSLEHIITACDRAANLTKSLLSFSRGEATARGPVKVMDIIRLVDKIFMRLIGEDINLRISVEEDLTILADSGQIAQILMNLVINARDAMPTGGSLLIEAKFVSEGELAKAGKYALIRVTDTGTGMDEKTQGKIFEPFFTTKGIEKGTGLGLYMAKTLVSQNNGHINVWSKPGQGTVFI